MVQVTTPQGQLADQGSTQAPAPSSGGDTDLAGQWRDWIGRPSNRAALMQFGIAMLQPVGIGQSQIGNIANAIGEGGEAAQRVSQQEMGREREASQEDLRTAQANLAEQRAGAQGTLATAREQAAKTAEERLGISRSALEQKGKLGLLSAQIAEQGRYQQYRNEKAKENSDILSPNYGKVQPQEWREWLMENNPQLAAQLGYGMPAEQEGLAPDNRSLQEREVVPAQSSRQIMTGPYKQHWEETKSWVQSGDRAKQTAARQRADALAKIVSDPQNVYRELGLPAPGGM